MTALLQLTGLGRDFGGLTALHGVSIDIRAGSRHAVIGPNGAGKTTLVNLIAGTLRPTRGAIVFTGRDITRLPAAARARHGIGRTWQHPAVFGRLTVTANLTLALTAHRPRTTTPAAPHDKTVTATATRLIGEAGLAEHATTLAGTLAYGLQRRLELAMALATRPRLLLLDEPSAGLDPDETANLTHLIRTLTDNTAVILVDHNLDLVWAVADTVTVLHHGRHLATGTPDQIRTDPRVHHAYLSTGDQPPPQHQPRNTPNRPNLLHVRGLSVGYQGATVLRQVDLDINQGEAVAVLGRNGTGKTTLLDTIAGLLQAHTASRIELAGQPLTTRRPHQRAHAGLALVPQGRRLFSPLTVAEHLTAAQAANRTAPHSTAWTVERILDLLPTLAARLRHPAQHLSGGEQQMLALARALLTNPRLLVLDEPSEGLAPAVIAQLTTTLAQLITDGLAVLIAEQNLGIATAITDRVIVLDAGRIAMSCPTHQLTEQTRQRQLHTLLGVADPTLDRNADITP